MLEKLEKVYCGKLTFFINNTSCIINTYNLYMSNFMLLKEKFIALEKNMIEKTCILKVLVNDDCLFFWCKNLAYFFATAKNRPANRKQSLQIYHKVLGEK